MGNMLKLFIMRYKLYKKYKERASYLRDTNGKLVEILDLEINNMERELYCEERMYFDNQHTFLWCPKCKEDLVGSNSFTGYNSTNQSHWNYECKKCGCESRWFNEGFAVILITSDVDEEIIKG